ncbi:MAG: hypothetical protein EOP83_00060 [Verrucomicrobiaceae bacterium]|nr:MAG: hypothetical protein EOP83_00060 [Verrucomicrobiaceae bacterium]
MNPYQPPAAPASSRIESSMPKRILLIGLLFCLVALLAIWDVADSAIKGHLSLNFGVLLLPTGIGLLRGRASSLPLARSWCLFALGLSIILVILSVAWSENASFRVFHFVVDGPYQIVPPILISAFIFLNYRLLRSEKAEAYCSRTSRPRPRHGVGFD